eukprot:TRINITY_DN27201_c0_g1_i1.p1 TRINITY_DN27201_c0_g1~~TRINITY_DN27201_c0_g1_i1.p1  ORF type:complete len:400 (+),score=56.32 TRINITY_DN27201_c0_g1_i1:46-1200(+)
MASSSSAASRGLSLSGLRRVRALWSEDVRRITLSKLAPSDSEIEGCHEGQLRLAQRTHRELKVRIAHRLKDFLFLPYKAMANRSVRLLYEKYVGAYNMHEDISLRSQEDVERYWIHLASTFEGHRNVTKILGTSRRRIINLDASLEPVFDAFLDRFFVSRLGTHMLGSNFLNRVPQPPGVKKPAGIAMGALQPTRPALVITALADSLANASALDGPRVPVIIEQGSSEKEMLYIPSHLRGILKEILQNSINASAKIAQEKGLIEPPPMHVKLNQGQFGMFVTISDQAGGIQNPQRIWRWGKEEFEYDAPFEEDDELEEAKLESLKTPLPLGFGLPLARLTARYFGGDVRLQTLIGYGTNVYIHIPELQEDGKVGADDAGGAPVI